MTRERRRSVQKAMRDSGEGIPTSRREKGCEKKFYSTASGRYGKLGPRKNLLLKERRLRLEEVTALLRRITEHEKNRVILSEGKIVRKPDIFWELQKIDSRYQSPSLWEGKREGLIYWGEKEELAILDRRMRLQGKTSL